MAPAGLGDLTLRGPAYEWALWSTTVRLAVADPHHLPAAKRLVDRELARVELAASRFRPDSELRRLAVRGGRPTRVSDVLSEMLEVALAAARATAGAVDPTLGDALAALGYDRDFAEVAEASRRRDGIRVVRRPAPGWQRIELDAVRRVVSVPADIRLDLGSTAKAWAADRCARAVAEQLGIGVLVSLGGDIATAGAGPDGGWRVLVRDQPDDPAALVTLPSGGALATSSTRSRQWQREGRELHHILDPATCQPVEPVWRSVTVAAETCVEANTWSTAAVVRGRGAAGLLAGRHLAARLVSEDGVPLHVGGWPAGAEVRRGVQAVEVASGSRGGPGAVARRATA
jgi:thiamine biosynthesis lipoprotein